MRATLLALVLALPAVAEGPLTPTPESSRSVQRYLASLRLGDTLKEIKTVYPPKRKWSSYKEPGGRLTRINVERSTSKWFPPKVSQLSIGLRFGRLAHVQVVYTVESTRAKPLSELVADLSLMYGEPRRWGETYFWFDSATVIAASYQPLKTTKGVELRTSLELMEKGVFEPFR
jgi:hypothetical protein